VKLKIVFDLELDSGELPVAQGKVTPFVERHSNRLAR